MTKQEVPKEYQQWLDEEKQISQNLYNDYKNVVGTGFIPVLPGRTTNRSFFLRFVAAAILILALGTTLWVKKDDIFKPNYTKEQIALSYDQTLRALAVCANSLSSEMGNIKKINQIPESLSDIKTLKTVINN